MICDYLLVALKLSHYKLFLILGSLQGRGTSNKSIIQRYVDIYRLINVSQGNYNERVITGLGGVIMFVISPSG